MTPRVPQSVLAMCAWVPAKSSAIGPVTLLVAETYSASRYSKPVGRCTRTRCNSPVTGFLIGSAFVSTSPGTRTRAVPAFSSIASSIALNWVGSPVVIVVLNTWVISEPGSVSWPCAIASIAARCSGFARSSITAIAVPPPRWIGPGQLNSPPKRNPSSGTLPKWPRSIWKNTSARQWPWVGRALNWQGQPTAQLQFEIWMPWMRQSTYAIAISFFGAAPGILTARARRARNLLREPAPHQIRTLGAVVDAVDADDRDRAQIAPIPVVRTHVP